MESQQWPEKSSSALAMQVRLVQEEKAQLREENDRLRMRVKILEGFRPNLSAPACEQPAQSQISTLQQVDIRPADRFADRPADLPSGSDLTEDTGSLPASGSVSELPPPSDIAPTASSPEPRSESFHPEVPQVKEKLDLPSPARQNTAPLIAGNAKKPLVEGPEPSLSDLQLNTPKRFHPVDDNALRKISGTHRIIMCRTPDIPSLGRARRGSRYLDSRNGTLQIKDDAVIMQRGLCKPLLRGRLVLSDLIQPRDLLVGIEYKDGTSLSYLPVRDTRLHGAPNPRLIAFTDMKNSIVEKDYGKTFIHACMPLWVYKAILKTAGEQYHIFGPEDSVSECQVLQERGRAWFHFAVTETLSVTYKEEGRIYQKSMADALLDIPNGLVGDGLFTMRYRRQTAAVAVQVQFQLHSLLLRFEESICN